MNIGSFNTIKSVFTPSQFHQIEKFGRIVNGLGCGFAVCDSDGKMLWVGDGIGIKFVAGDLKKISMHIFKSDKSSGSTFVGKVQSLKKYAAIAVCLNIGSNVPGLIALVGSVKESHRKYLCEILGLFAENLEISAKADNHIQTISTELAQTYEELVLLQKLSTNMKISGRGYDYLQMACDNLTDIVGVEGIAIILEKKIGSERKLVVVAGSGLIDINDHMAAVLLNRLEKEITSCKEALLDSDVDMPFKYSWSDNIKNIIAVPLYSSTPTSSYSDDLEGNSNIIIGLMVAVNRLDKPDFDSTDMKLFNSVANSCAVFLENGSLFEELKELFIGSLKALTNSIDAKDQYTRGHSERVAFISRWIAENCDSDMNIDEETKEKIYLAGLLHDIGKVGVDEAILRKKTKLTETEFDHIKRHPSTGASILSGIRQMRDIVPGVLCHHERVDGKGYPNGLKGDQIPVIGKIIGLADCFDAMTSKRTYRQAMTIEKALAEIKNGIGTQFDEKIAKVFLNSDIYRLWDIIYSGGNTLYTNNNSIDYGTVAVETLLK